MPSQVFSIFPHRFETGVPSQDLFNHLRFIAVSSEYKVVEIHHYKRRADKGNHGHEFLILQLTDRSDVKIHFRVEWTSGHGHETVQKSNATNVLSIHASTLYGATFTYLPKKLKTSPYYHLRELHCIRDTPIGFAVIEEICNEITASCIHSVELDICCWLCFTFVARLTCRVKTKELKTQFGHCVAPIPLRFLSTMGKWCRSYKLLEVNHCFKGLFTIPPRSIPPPLDGVGDHAPPVSMSFCSSRLRRRNRSSWGANKLRLREIARRLQYSVAHRAYSLWPGTCNHTLGVCGVCAGLESAAPKSDKRILLTNLGAWFCLAFLISLGNVIPDLCTGKYLLRILDV